MEIMSLLGLDYDSTESNVGASIVGGVETYENDYDAPATKDATTRKLIPENISECALYLGPRAVCMSDGAASTIGESLGIKGAPAAIIDGAKKTLDCESERCVLDKMRGVLGDQRTKGEIQTYLKVQGPTDNALLSNVHIDSTLEQWAAANKDLFAFNFNMRNYASYSLDHGYVVERPDTLATIPFIDLYDGEYNSRKYKCACCVINTDVYQGNGKHWMALFADTRDPTDWTVEFFNSSGNNPAPEWINWMEKTKNMMELIIQREKSHARARMIKVSSIRHQQSRTECGLYSLFYIYARMNRVPIDYFMTTPVPDQLMFEFRQHLFDDPGGISMKKFSWSEFKNSVDVKWE